MGAVEPIVRDRWIAAALGIGAFALYAAVGALAAGASSPGVSNVIVPDIAPGAWFLIATADDGGLVAEASETNNTFARLITINR